MVKHTQTIRRQQPTNCLGVFDHSVGLALKGLSETVFNLRLKCRFVIIVSGTRCTFVEYFKIKANF